MALIGRLLRWLATILSFIAAFMLVGVTHEWLPGLSGRGGLLLIMAIVTFVIFVHELGHALAFRWQGGVVEEFAVLFLAWRRRPIIGNGHIGWARWMGGDVGGYVIGHFGATIPTRRKAIVVAAAGPLANVLLTLVCLTLAWALSLAMPTIWPDHQLAIDSAAVVAGPPPPGAELARLPDAAAVEAIMAQVDWLHRLAFVQGFIMLIALNSAGVGLINLIPFTGSDGAAILRHWSRRPTRRGTGS